MEKHHVNPDIAVILSQNMAISFLIFFFPSKTVMLQFLKNEDNTGTP